MAAACRIGAALACALVSICALPSLGRAQSSQAVAPSATTPVHHQLTAARATSFAGRDPEVGDVLEEHAGYSSKAHGLGAEGWRISYFDVNGKEFAQAIVSESPRHVAHVWTGDQVAWQMARGIPGAFGRKASAVYVWVPLMAIFFLAFFDWRKPLRMVHLDLLVLLSFSISQVFFNRGDIDVSVPLAYPPLIYLLARTLMLAWAPAVRARRVSIRPIVPVAYLAIALVFLVGFRIGLNVANSNVIDVGYSGVIGADRITHGHSPYGNFPKDNGSGDTYGPVAYYAYVPAEAAFPFNGKWDDLPAAHAASIGFDLLTIAGLFLLGRRLRAGPRGTELGVMLAFAWAAFPYTLYAMNSNVNDSLIAALLVLSLLVVGSPLGRGVAVALATATKFAPALLVPLLASYDRRRLRDAWPFAVALTLTLVVVTLPLMPDGGLRELWDRTIGFQLGRESPFSVWGRYESLGWLQTASKIFAVALAGAVSLWPARKRPTDVAALGAAVLIAVEITFNHWFYTYIVWWLPFVLVALLARGTRTSLERAATPVR